MSYFRFFKLSSALKCLTSVFGMGTGVSFLLSPPYSFELLRSKLNIISRKKPYSLLRFWSSPRLISTGPLHSSQNFHSQPIYLIVFEVSYCYCKGNLILRGASHLDAFSAYPFRT